jgi:transcriptional regulator with XRE-family HTH domain
MTDPRRSTALPAHVLERPDVQEALRQHDFGAVFALARKWAGISYSQIAEACGIKPERVGTLARGEGSIATYEKIAQLADALKIPGSLVGLSPRQWESAALLDKREEDLVLRRDFLRDTAITVGLTLAAPASTTGGRRISAATPQRLLARAARLRKLDDVLGGGDTYRLYRSEYEATKQMLRQASYTENVGKQLLAVLAEQAQQAGWAAFDAGDQEQARLLYKRSHEAAGEAGNAPLAGNALAFLAYQRIGSDRAAALSAAVESCHTAGKDAPKSVRALLHERLAWAHAVAGNATEAEAALNSAQDALGEQPVTQEQPDWAAWVNHSELQIMTGRCWTELRRPLRAVPVLEAVLSRFDDTHARDKSLYLCWLADAYLSAGEVDQAAAVASKVIDLSADVASVRPRERLAPLLGALARHRSVPGVREVLDAARD